MFFKVGATASHFFVLALGIYLCYLAFAGKRASSGLTPRSHQLPIQPVKALFVVGSTYVITWSTIQLGLDFGALNTSSKPVLLLEAFHRSVGRAFIEIFLLVWFALFGWSMARLCFARGISPLGRFFAVFGLVASLVVVIANCCLLVRLVRLP